MKKIFQTFVLLTFAFCVFAFPQGKGGLTGKITDSGNGETLLGVNLLLQGTYYGAASDINGKYSITNINPGTYTVVVSLIGYKTL